MEAAKTGKITLGEGEIAALSWVKAKASSHNGACVELAAASGNIAMRDSKDPAGPVLVYTPAEFAAFLDGARNGEFDSLLRLSGRAAAMRARPEMVMCDEPPRGTVSAGNHRSARLTERQH